jgi:hypothetical protein
VRWHRQIDALPSVDLIPAEILEKAIAFGELDAEPLGFDEVLIALEDDEEIAHGTEVASSHPRQLPRFLPLVESEWQNNLG